MKEKLKYYLYLALLYPLALLPLCVLYRLSDLLYLVLGRMMHYREKVVLQNLTSSFPEKSPEEIRKIQHDFYRHLCDIIVETIKLLHISDKQLRRRMVVENYEAVDRVAAGGGNSILFIGHFGNWEWVPTVSLYYNKDIISAHLYKPLRDAASDRLMKKIRGRFNSTGIPQASAVRTILGMRAEGRPFIVGFIADQRSNNSLSHQRTDFLNHVTPYNVGAETIGDKIGATFFYADISQRSRGHYTLRFTPMQPAADNETHPYTRLYLHMLEQNIRRQPYLWLWSHRRWLYK